MLGQDLSNRGRQGRLPMIDVSNRPNVHVRLASIKLFLTHLFVSRSLTLIKKFNLGRRACYVAREATRLLKWFIDSSIQ
jgi:hypothetical protein